MCTNYILLRQLVTTFAIKPLQVQIPVDEGLVIFPVEGVVGLGILGLQAHCLRRYGHILAANLASSLKLLALHKGGG